MGCIVCGKPITDGANTCSLACMAATRLGGDKTPPEGGAVRPARVGKASSVSSLVSKIQNMRLQPTPTSQEVPMLCVSHPWIKGKNVVAGNTVFSFDMNGIAKVKDIGRVRDDIASLCSRPGSQFKLIENGVVEVPAAPAAPAAPTPVPHEETVRERIPVKEPEPLPPPPDVPAVEDDQEAAPNPEEPVRKPAKRRK